MNDDVLNNMAEGNGGGVDKLNRPDVQKKLQQYYGKVHPKPDESVERMKARNAAIRLAKKVPPRTPDGEQG